MVIAYTTTTYYMDFNRADPLLQQYTAVSWAGKMNSNFSLLSSFVPKNSLSRTVPQYCTYILYVDALNTKFHTL